MTTAMTTTNGTAMGAQLERVLISGDLAGLTPDQRVTYYNEVCKSVGLNPLTKPFDYLKLNGKEILYAKRDCTDQLRKIHKVSITVAARELVEDCYIVTARATDAAGRIDESTGAVAIGNLRGEARANAMMKAETKAKRRVTLSICGLGMLDETETDSIPGAMRMDSTPPPVARTPREVVTDAVSEPSPGKWSPPGDDGEAITDEQIGDIRKALLSKAPDGLGWSKVGAKAWVKKLFGVEQPGDLSRRMAEIALGLLIHRQVGEEPYRTALGQALEAGEVMSGAVGDE